jgi:DNA mismatch repair protein MutS2
VENLVREIRESQANREAIKRAKRTLSEELSRHSETEVGREEPREVLKEGDTVFVEPFKAKGRVKSLTKTSVRVEVGRITCEVPLSSVSMAEPQEAEEPPPVRTSEPSASFELNLIGRTRDEALQALDKHIDTAFMSGLAIVRIVHGKGAGILKKAVEESLKADSRIEAFREGLREEGGWGVTIAKLKT